MDSISIKSWNNTIATTAIIDGKIVIGLEDKKYACFSPLNFEETIQIQENFYKDSNISNIGILSDSISGSYGKDYFNKYFLNERGVVPTIIDRLSFIGRDGLGSLEFSPSDDESSINEPSYFSLSDFKNISADVYNKDTSHPLAKLIAKSNSGAGGAKAKAIVQYNPDTKDIYLSQINSKKIDDYKKCIIKFNNAVNSQEIDRLNDELKTEYIYYLLATEAGIKMSQSWLEKDNDDNYYFITKRFDVDDNDNRFHMHSLAGILSHDASPFSLGYEQLFRIGNMLSVSQEDKEQMFRTMVFNLVFANRDDHSRNFSFLMNEEHEWRYSPAYDLTYSGTNHNMQWHQLTIDSKPSKNIRTLSINKVAKICGIKNHKDIFQEMINLKKEKIPNLFAQYGVEYLSEMIFEDTKDIDQIFGGTV